MVWLRELLWPLPLANNKSCKWSASTISIRRPFIWFTDFKSFIWKIHSAYLYLDSANHCHKTLFEHLTWKLLWPRLPDSKNYIALLFLHNFSILEHVSPLYFLSLSFSEKTKRKQIFVLINNLGWWRSEGLPSSKTIVYVILQWVQQREREVSKHNII